MGCLAYMGKKCWGWWRTPMSRHLVLVDTKPRYPVPKPTPATSSPPVSCWSLAPSAPSQKPENKDTGNALHTDGPPEARREERIDRGRWGNIGHTPPPTSHTLSREMSFPQTLPIQCFPSWSFHHAFHSASPLCFYMWKIWEAHLNVISSMTPPLQSYQK